MNRLQPKERFQKSKEAERHKELVVTDQFKTILEMSLTQLVLELPKPNNPAESWDQGCRIEGAKRVLEIILNLAEPVKDLKPMIDKGLKPDPTLTK